MPKYTYKCDTCGHDYVEFRDVADPRWITECPVTGCTGTLQSA